MTTSAVNQASSLAPEQTRPRAEVPLSITLPARVRLPAAAPLLALAVGVVFCFFSHQPLWHTDLWGHLEYGNRILSIRAIPKYEPLMRLSEGVPFVDTAWLSQVVGAAVWNSFGIPGIQALYSAAVGGSLALLLWRGYRATGNGLFCLLGAALFLWVNWKQLEVIRPQLAGLVCFSLVLFLLTSPAWTHRETFGIPVVFIFWTNLHGSFPVGLAVIAAFAAGRLIDLLLRERDLQRIIKDEHLKRFLIAGLFATVAVSVNPYRFDLYGEVFAIASHPNLQDLVDWQPLDLGMSQGRAAAVTAVGLMVLYWLSPRRISAVEVLLLVSFAAGCLWASRMLLWWGVIACGCFVLHGDALWKKYRCGTDWQSVLRTRENAAPAPRESLWTVLSAGILWAFFSMSPLGMLVLYGGHEDLHHERQYSRWTPVEAAEALHQIPYTGQMFHPYEWGDFLLWRKPGRFYVFVASHAHLVPDDVWKDYHHISNAQAGWSNLLDNYEVQVVILDRARQAELLEEISRHSDWVPVFQDEISVIFVRRVSSKTL